MMNSLSIANMAPRVISDHRQSSLFASTSNSTLDYGRIRPCVARLPCISGNMGDNHTVLDDIGPRLLEDMESILEGVNNASTTETTLEECRHYAKPRLYPRLNSDSVKLMTKQKHQWLHTTGTRHDQVQFSRTVGCRGLNEQMEQYLKEGLARVLLEKAEDITDPGGQVVKSWPLFKAVSRKTEFENTHAVVPTISIVWVLQPTVRKGKTKFKFSTDFGAYFLIKKDELIEFLDIMKCFCKNDKNSSLRCNAFYQVYTMDKRRSRVIKGDAVVSLIEEMTTHKEGNLPNNPATTARQTKDNEEYGHTDVNVVSASTPTSTIIMSNAKDESKKGKGANRRRSHGLVKSFTRYLNRRRLKRIIRQQTGIALCNMNGRSR